MLKIQIDILMLSQMDALHYMNVLNTQLKEFQTGSSLELEMKVKKASLMNGKHSGK